MRLGERALARQRRADRDGEQLGECFQLGPALRPVHALAGVDDRPLGGEQHLRRLADRVRIGSGAQRAAGHVGRHIRLLVPDVLRHLDEAGPAAPRAQARERTPHDVGKLARQHDRLGGLRDAAHLDAGIEIGLDPGALARVAARHHQHRHAVAERLRHRAVAVLGAGSVLHHEHAELVAAGDARDRVGHVQAGAFLPHHDRPDADGRAALEDVVDRIPDDDLNSLLAQDVRDGVGDFHWRFPLGFSFGRHHPRKRMTQ